MSEISEDNKRVAKTMASAFGGKPAVREFWDDDHKRSVDILTCEDAPQRGVNSYGTIRLSDYPLIFNGEEYPVRLEMVGACGKQFNGFDNALATAAFCVMNSHWFCAPGVVFPDVLAMYKCSSTMKHFFFVSPFLWEEKLETLTLKGKSVAWLLAVPISDAERDFAEAQGPNALEERFVEEQIDIFDLNRKSIL